MVTKPFDWRFVDDAELAKLAEEFTASQIGDKLGCSRNAVIGRCSRRGIKLNAQAAHSYVRPVAVVKRPRVRHVIAPKLVKLAATEPVNIFVEHLSLTLMQLRADSCRWPLWKGDTPHSEKRYCGVKASAGQTYCDHCRALSYQPRTRDAANPRPFRFARAA